MKTKYIIECWNPFKNSYELAGEWNTHEQAVNMFNKPYFRRATRRLVKISNEVLYKTKRRVNSW